MARKLELSEDRESLVKLLQNYIQSANLNFLIGSAASLPAINVAGDIENQINTLIEEDKEHEANLLALNFIRELEDTNKDIVAKIGSSEIDETLIGYTNFLSTVDRVLFERKNQLLPRQANIFTTNYDVFFERAASELSSIILNDGFDRQSFADSKFPFTPEKYFDRTYRSGNVYDRQAEVPTFNLIKLHGSLTWERDKQGEIFFSNKEYPALTADDEESSEAIVKALSERTLVLPNIKKFKSTVLERVYFDLLRLYSNALDKENALLVVFGFSFSDEHILDITKRALRNPTAQVIIFAYSQESAADFMGKFQQQRNVLIISPTEGGQVTIDQLNETLGSIVPLIESDDE